MKILFLDDDATRHKRFLMANIGRDVHQAWDYEQACRALDAHVFDEAHLDHDLSDMAAAGMPAKDEKTGTHVAEYIAAMLESQRPRLVVLHSFNDAGWRRMGRILHDAGVRCVRQQFGKGL
jgi:hypothetical protein